MASKMAWVEMRKARCGVAQVEQLKKWKQQSQSYDGQWMVPERQDHEQRRQHWQENPWQKWRDQQVAVRSQRPLVLAPPGSSKYLDNLVQGRGPAEGAEGGGSRSPSNQVAKKPQSTRPESSPSRYEAAIRPKVGFPQWTGQASPHQLETTPVWRKRTKPEKAPKAVSIKSLRMVQTCVVILVSNIYIISMYRNLFLYSCIFTYTNINLNTQFFVKHWHNLEIFHVNLCFTAGLLNYKHMKHFMDDHIAPVPKPPFRTQEIPTWFSRSHKFQAPFFTT